MGLKINPDATYKNNLMAFGWECDEGWYPLIQELIDELIKVDWCDFELLQVKEKYGTLRFYIDHGTDEVYDIINTYEILSSHLCEHCGMFYTAKIRIKQGWWKTLCDKCTKKLDWK